MSRSSEHQMYQAFHNTAQAQVFRLEAKVDKQNKEILELSKEIEILKEKLKNV